MNLWFLSQTLESMLGAVKKGRPVNEAEIPPPVAIGAPSAAPRPAVPARPAPPVPSPPQPSQSRESEATSPQSPAAPDVIAPDVITPSSEEEQSSSAALSTLSSLPSPQEQTDEEAADVSQSDGQFLLSCTLDRVFLCSELAWRLQL